MSAFSGPQGKGARKRHKDAKRADATARDAVSNWTSQGRKARAGELDSERYPTGPDGYVTRNPNV